MNWNTYLRYVHAQVSNCLPTSSRKSCELLAGKFFFSEKNLFHIFKMLHEMERKMQMCKAQWHQCPDLEKASSTENLSAPTEGTCPPLCALLFLSSLQSKGECAFEKNRVSTGIKDRDKVGENRKAILVGHTHSHVSRFLSCSSCCSSTWRSTSVILGPENKRALCEFL